jgi:hypothetical protein
LIIKMIMLGQLQEKRTGMQNRIMILPWDQMCDDDDDEERGV